MDKLDEAERARGKRIDSGVELYVNGAIKRRAKWIGKRWRWDCAIPEMQEPIKRMIVKTIAEAILDPDTFSDVEQDVPRHEYNIEGRIYILTKRDLIEIVEDISELVSIMNDPVRTLDKFSKAIEER